MALSKITASSNIISVSRISNNRLWDFFKNGNIANNKQSNNVLILLLMNLLIIYVNLLTHPNERFYQMFARQYHIWIYNIINTLKKTGVRTTSPITSPKAGFTTNDFAHITNFRRQAYIHPDDPNLLPGFLTVNLEETAFRICVTDEKVTCSFCKQLGHFSSACKNCNIFVLKKNA